jgi:hypothetical protein
MNRELGAGYGRGMSSGGQACPRRARLVSALVMCSLLGACAAGSDADLEDRVEELEQENAELREQLAAGSGGTAVDAGAGPTTSTSTTSTSTTTTTTKPAAVRGSRERPIGLGRRVRAGDWVYRVVAFEPNADEAVAALDESNQPAGEGNVYARLRLRAVYRGEGAGDPRRLRINLVSPDGKSIGEASVCCRPARDTLNDQAETFSGGIAEGWIYYIISSEDAFGGKFLAFDPAGEFPGVPGGIGFFRVN